MLLTWHCCLQGGQTFTLSAYSDEYRNLELMLLIEGKYTLEIAEKHYDRDWSRATAQTIMDDGSIADLMGTLLALSELDAYECASREASAVGPDDSVSAVASGCRCRYSRKCRLGVLLPPGRFPPETLLVRRVPAALELRLIIRA